MRQSKKKQVVAHREFPIFRGSTVKVSRYFPQTVKEWQNNPLLEALMPRLEPSVRRERLKSMPEYHDGLREEAAIHRISMTRNTRRFVMPNRLILRLEEATSNALRWGYADRNPFSVRPVQKNREAMTSEAFMEAPLPPLPRGADVLFVYGDPGTGKSTAIERVLLLQPQVLLHTLANADRSFTQQQLTWLKLHCPSNGSLKQLLLSFFAAVDAILGTNYTTLFQVARKSAELLRPDMVLVAQKTNLGLLVIDEIQNLSQASSGGAAVVINMLVMLVEDFGVPVMFIGTQQAVSLFQTEFRLARRADGAGSFSSRRMAPDDEWDQFVAQLWFLQYTAKPTPLTAPLKAALYNVSQGIADIACKVYGLVQIRAILNRKIDPAEQITPELFESVAIDRMGLTYEVLAALRAFSTAGTPQPDFLRDRMGDLQLDDNAFDKMIKDAQAAERAVELLFNLREQGMDGNSGQQVVQLLQKIPKVTEQLAFTAVRNALAGLGAKATTDELLKVATAEAEKLVIAAAARPLKKSPRPNNAGLALVELVEQGAKQGQDGHTSLSMAGYIRDPLSTAGLNDKEQAE